MDRPNLHVQDSITEEKAISRVKEITIEKRRGEIFVSYMLYRPCQPQPLKQNKNKITNKKHDLFLSLSRFLLLHI